MSDRDDCATGDGKAVNDGGVYCHDCADRIGRVIRRARVEAAR